MREAPAFFTMKRYAHTVMYAIGAIAAMAAIGVSYERCIGPSQPVWHKDARDWASIPLKVSWDREFWGKAHSESFDLSLESWNRQVDGRTLLVPSDDSSRSEVRIMTANGEPCGQRVMVSGADAAAEAWLCPDGTAEIQISSPGTNNCSARIAMHELGHALGLAHTPAGIMRPKIGCDDLMIPSDAQGDSLQRRYGVN